MLIGDCASDPPLAATERALATARADDVVYGLGAAALARGHKQLALAVADAAARAALERAIAAIGADVAILEVAAAWPAVSAGVKDEVLPASMLVAIAEAARAKAQERADPATVTVSVVGAVHTPAVVQAAPATTMSELVARVGGALEDDWVAIAGGAPAGCVVTREATLAEAGAPSVVLLLPARHALVRRLRTTVGDWLWRAASACEGCRACGEACPSGLATHALVATLATGREVTASVELARGTSPGPVGRSPGPVASFAACTGCGVCDAACPAGLSPRALAVDVRERLMRGGVTVPAAAARRAGIDRALLTLRLGLAMYDRPVVTLA